MNLVGGACTPGLLPAQGGMLWHHPAGTPSTARPTLPSPQGATPPRTSDTVLAATRWHMGRLRQREAGVERTSSDRDANVFGGGAGGAGRGGVLTRQLPTCGTTSRAVLLVCRCRDATCVCMCWAWQKAGPPLHSCVAVATGCVLCLTLLATQLNKKQSANHT